jgi:CRP-like cAMP-binding protein
VFDSGFGGRLGERLRVLHRSSLIGSLPPSELALLAREARERELPVGAVLAIEGQPVESVLVLISGRAEVTRGGHSIGSVGPSEALGLFPLAAAIPHRSGARAAEPIRGLQIEADLFAELLEDDAELFVRVLRSAAANARAIDHGQPAIRAGGTAPGFQRSTNDGPALDPAQKLLALRATNFFRSAPVDGLAAFTKRLEVVRLGPGEALAPPAEAGEIRIVTAGILDVGDVQVGPGTVLGLVDGLAGVSSRQVVRARTPAQLLRGTVSDLLDVIEDHHGLGRRLLGEILSGTTG